MEKILIGKITSAVGLKGEVKIYSYAGSPDRFEQVPAVYVGKETYEVTHARYQKGLPVVAFAGITSRDQAEKLRGLEVYMDAKDLPELPEGEFYIRDMVGMEVLDAESGAAVGTLADVMTGRAQDIYVVKTTEGKECLIPAVEAFVSSVDMEARQIRVRLIDGLL